MPARPLLFGRAILRLCRLPARERRLVIEAIGLLLLARLALTFVSFERIGQWASVDLGRPPPDPDERDRIRRNVRSAVTRSARHVPWRAVCFDEGLAAQHMLRRRGIPSNLYLGVDRKPDRSLGAHVWVRDGEVDIVGGHGAERFTPLIHFPRA
ncbi:MAG TPA: lasso peptide biosynthesis B2 protein [Aliidongia sp.]|nr:lasso peptide biosynthesis B2 protein [Aliidongia sp.]